MIAETSQVPEIRCATATIFSIASATVKLSAAGRGEFYRSKDTLFALAAEAIENADAAKKNQEHGGRVVTHFLDRPVSAFEEAEQQDACHDDCEQAGNNLEPAHDIQHRIAEIDDIGEEDE